MEFMLERSRSVIVDCVGEKIKKDRYERHLMALEKIKKANSSLSTLTKQGKKDIKYYKQLNRYRTASQQIKNIFDDGILYHKNLISHIENIYKHKSTDKFDNSRQTHLKRDHTSQKSQEKKKIMLENKILKSKINNIRKGMLNRGKLKELYAEHDRMVKHVRKIR